MFLSTKKANGEIFNIGYGKPENLKNNFKYLSYKKGKPNFSKIKKKKKIKLLIQILVNL